MKQRFFKSILVEILRSFEGNAATSTKLIKFNK